MKRLIILLFCNFFFTLFAQNDCNVSINVANPVIQATLPVTFTLYSTSRTDLYLWSNNRTANAISVTLQPGQQEQIILNGCTFLEENIIKNGDFSSGNIEFSSDLQISESDSVLLPGYYTVTDNTQNISNIADNCNFNGNKFLTVRTLQNETSKIFSQDIVLDGNSDYLLSFQATSFLLLEHSAPINKIPIGVKIDNEYLEGTDSIENNHCVLQKFYKIYHSGNNTNINLSIESLPSLAEDPIFAITDISLRKICLAQDSVTLKVIEPENTCGNKILTADSTVKYSYKNETFIVKAQYDADGYIWNNGQYKKQTEFELSVGEEKNIVLTSYKYLSDTEYVINGDFSMPFEYWESDLENGENDASYGKYDYLSEAYFFNQYGTQDEFQKFSGEGLMFVANGPVNQNKNMIISQPLILEKDAYYLLSYQAGQLNNYYYTDEYLALLQWKIQNGVTFEQDTLLNGPDCNIKTFYHIFKAVQDTVTISLYDNNLSDNGNDFVLDNISVRKVCIGEDSLTVKLLENTDTLDIGVCENRYPVYIFSDRIDSSGEYKIVDNNTLHIVRVKDNKIHYDTLKAVIEQGKYYNRNGFYLNTSGVYSLYLTDTNGCDSVTVLDLKVYPKLEVIVPNAFTPQKDNNNLFGYYPTNESFIFVYFEVYNRWGTKVFFSDREGVFWDGNYGGNLCENGNYVWRLFYKTEYSGGKLYEKHGTVLLLK